MSNQRDNSRKGYIRTTQKEGPNLKQDTVILSGLANTPIAVTNSYSGAMSFEVANPSSDLSGSATINVQISVSGVGDNWIQATDSNGDNLTYTLTAGSVVIEAISGIPLGTPLRLIVVETVTGTLEIAKRQ